MASSCSARARTVTRARRRKARPSLRWLYCRQLARAAPLVGSIPVCRSGRQRLDMFPVSAAELTAQVETDARLVTTAVGALDCPSKQLSMHASGQLELAGQTVAVEGIVYGRYDGKSHVQRYVAAARGLCRARWCSGEAASLQRSCSSRSAL